MSITKEMFNSDVMHVLLLDKKIKFILKRSRTFLFKYHILCIRPTATEKLRKLITETIFSM